MRVLLQRVSHAAVAVNGERIGEIGPGLLALVGIHAADTEAEVQWMAEKIANIRIFEDESGKMNRSVQEIHGSVLAVSQFTLLGEMKKGNRSNFMAAAPPERAEELYERLLALLRERLGRDQVACGKFQAKMRVELANEGPVTVMLER